MFHGFVCVWDLAYWALIHWPLVPLVPLFHILSHRKPTGSPFCHPYLPCERQATVDFANTIPIDCIHLGTKFVCLLPICCRILTLDVIVETRPVERCVLDLVYPYCPSFSWKVLEAVHKTIFIQLSSKGLCLHIHLNIYFCPSIEVISLVILVAKHMMPMPVYQCSVNHVPDAHNQIKVSHTWAWVLVFSKTLG